MKYIKKASNVNLPITGTISGTWNVDNKKTNTISMELFENTFRGTTLYYNESGTTTSFEITDNISNYSRIDVLVGRDTGGVGGTLVPIMLNAKFNSYPIHFIDNDSSQTKTYHARLSIKGTTVTISGNNNILNHSNTGTASVLTTPLLAVYMIIGYKEVNFGTIKEASASNIPVGSGMDYYGTTPPDNYLFADGSLLSRAEYPELFAVIGITYGAGDGSTTFALPDKRERVSVMYKSGSTNFGTLGGKVGNDTHSLTSAQMPSHLHSFSKSFTASGTSNIYLDGNPIYYYGNGQDGGPDWKWFNTALSSKLNTGTTLPYVNVTVSGSVSGNTGSTGSGSAHNNIQQSLVCNYIIRVK